MANEKRLIDANAFLRDILTAGIGKTIIEYSESDIGYMIRKRPTIDAVEVVRCKDCIRRYDTDECPMCFVSFRKFAEYTTDNGYCDRGERRKESEAY
jgi:hypothetical protein